MRNTATPQPRTLRPPFGTADRPVIARAIAEGQVMSYPTETSYALGGNALDPALVDTIFRLKGRPRDKAILLLVNGGRGLAGLARDISPAASHLMEAFWPGPLTLVFWAAPGLPLHLRERRGTVALRWSADPVAAELLRIGGAPLIGTSANRGGEAPARTMAEVLAVFGDAVTLALDGGETPGGPPSTLLDTTTRPFQVPREGVIPASALREALKKRFPEEAPKTKP